MTFSLFLSVLVSMLLSADVERFRVSRMRDVQIISNCLHNKSPQLDGSGWRGSVRQAQSLLTPGLLTPVPVAAVEKVAKLY